MALRQIDSSSSPGAGFASGYGFGRRGASLADGSGRNGRAEGGRFGNGARTGGVTRADRLQYRSRSEESASLTLTTAEGDQVTLSFSNKQSAKVDEGTVYSANGTFDRTSVRRSNETNVSVSVDGNLSDAELKDITDLVARLADGVRSGSFQDSGSAGSVASYQFAYQKVSEERLQATQAVA